MTATPFLGRRLIPAVLTMVLGTVIIPANGDDGTIYRWVDKEGRVHYSDCPPPPGCTADEVQAGPAPSEEQVRQAEEALEALLSQQATEAGAREQERREREQQQIAAMQQAVARKRSCVQAQQNLHALLMNRPVYYIDDKGERVFLDEAAHKAEIERQRQLVHEFCNGP